MVMKRHKLAIDLLERILSNLCRTLDWTVYRASAVTLRSRSAVQVGKEPVQFRLNGPMIPDSRKVTGTGSRRLRVKALPASLARTLPHRGDQTKAHMTMHTCQFVRIAPTAPTLPDTKKTTDAQE